MPSQARSAASVPKRAARVADRIVEDVMALGWPVGEVFGAEGELLDRYGVSRAVFREAVRLLEHREVARTRRGPGGGLVVTEPTVGAVIGAVVLYLHRVDARLDEVFEARLVLEEIACDLACQRLDEGDLIQLRSFVGTESPEAGQNPRALHNLVAASSHNPAIELFVDVLNRVAMLYSAGWRSFGLETEIAHAHSRIAEAVIAGDSATARRRMRIHLEAEADYLKRRRSTRQILPDSILEEHAPTGKLGEAVARSIARRVVVAGLRPGDLVGTEAELIESEGVSRAVFREAVRLLEYHQIARMRRGPGGGLFVMEPSPGAVTDVAAIYLARRGMRPSQLRELRSAVEVALVGLAVPRADARSRERIGAAVDRETSSAELESDFHAEIAAAAGNRALELIALVLIRLTGLNLDEKVAARIRTDRTRAHAAIAAAILEGDQDLARHRMQRHLTGTLRPR